MRPTPGKWSKIPIPERWNSICERWQTMETKNVIENLNDLLTKAYDAEEGFKKAAERAEGLPALQSFFRNQSDMRLQFGHELKQAISQYGGTPDKGSSTTAKLHQVWISVKDALTPNDDGEAILEECIRGEEAALADYEEKLQHADLPSDIQSLLSNQRTAIASSLATVRAKEKTAD
ncbi:PA2169 family four-helix-bundle protein [Luteolibacter sp. SL250]|uniref:ferritin-like domain-containing protein n=1 Tax=Luteolibacter sp. SL250 TaxID=2995170 RepID=UPI00226FE1F3|nr:PA2169 family four-helix-bundle protein [Luteolibacter sp. SL250]WAC19057.1 PA2169 family four-helix-bundle protein [Luteolibacter sp. SL250]